VPFERAEEFNPNFMLGGACFILFSVKVEYFSGLLVLSFD
jgi:hypothetical protein